MGNSQWVTSEFEREGPGWKKQHVTWATTCPILHRAQHQWLPGIPVHSHGPRLPCCLSRFHLPERGFGHPSLLRTPVFPPPHLWRITGWFRGMESGANVLKLIPVRRNGSSSSCSSSRFKALRLFWSPQIERWGGVSNRLSAALPTVISSLRRSKNQTGRGPPSSVTVLPLLPPLFSLR